MSNLRTFRQLFAIVHKQLKLVISQFMKNFFIHKAELMEELLDGTLCRINFCLECTSDFSCLQFNKSNKAISSTTGLPDLCLSSRLVSHSFYCQNTFVNGFLALHIIIHFYCIWSQFFFHGEYKMALIVILSLFTIKTLKC